MYFNINYPAYRFISNNIVIDQCRCLVPSKYPPFPSYIKPVLDHNLIKVEVWVFPFSFYCYRILSFLLIILCINHLDRSNIILKCYLPFFPIPIQSISVKLCFLLTISYSFTLFYLRNWLNLSLSYLNFHLCF